MPPRAPQHEGLYDKIIGIVKGHLEKSLYHKMGSLAELQTLLAEIESSLKLLFQPIRFVKVNNRPITYQTDSINDTEPLTLFSLASRQNFECLPP